MTIALFQKHRLLSRRGLGLGALLLAGIVGYTVHAARASIPTTNALVYAGTLMDGSGAPLEDEHPVEIGVFDADMGGTPVCPVAQAAVTPDASGGFKMQLDDACATQIEQNANLWLEVKVDGTPVARTKLGAVPYAIEAKNAEHAVLADDSTTLEGNSAADFANASHAHAFSSLTGIPSGLSDGDDNTTYTNGTGISLNGTTFSADTAYMQRRAAGMSTTCNGANQSIKTIAADGTVTCEADNDTTYSAGSGLSLSSGTFSVGATTLYQLDTATANPATANTPAHAFCALTHLYLYAGSSGHNRTCDVTRNANGTWTVTASSMPNDANDFIECFVRCF